jgi:ABC-2 type transport system permease protein
MTLYKTIWTLLKANKSNLLIGVLITVGVTFFYAQSIDVENTSLQEANIALISEEESPVVDGLRDYLKEKQTLVTLEGTSQKEIDDALYFNRINIVLHLPVDFTEQVEAGQMPAIEIQSRPDAFSKTIVTQQVNTYLQTLLLFKEEGKTVSEAIEQAQTALAVTGQVELSTEYSQRMKKC